MMAVTDHPVHPMTKFAETPRPGCYNKPRAAPGSGYWVLVRKYMPDGRYYLEDEFIKNVMSKVWHDGVMRKDSNGKIIKSPNYTEPNLEPFINYETKGV